MFQSLVIGNSDELLGIVTNEEEEKTSEDNTFEDIFEDVEEVTNGLLECIHDDEPLGFENGVVK